MTDARPMPVKISATGSLHMHIVRVLAAKVSRARCAV